MPETSPKCLGMLLQAALKWGKVMASNYLRNPKDGKSETMVRRLTSHTKKGVPIPLYHPRIDPPGFKRPLYSHHPHMKHTPYFIRPPLFIIISVDRYRISVNGYRYYGT